MYVWMRTYTAKIGKMAEALAITADAVKHLKKRHSVNVETYTQLGGDPMKIVSAPPSAFFRTPN